MATDLDKYMQMATVLANPDIIYSDFLPGFDPHPVTGDLVRLANAAAVKQSIKNLVLTKKVSRPFQPYLGSSVSQYLFDQQSPQAQQDIQDEITRVITNYETRCSLASVVVTPNGEQSGYNAVITFTILNNNTPITMNLPLERIR